MPSVDLVQLAAFAWFAWVGSITPGPNIALAVAVAAAHGRRAVRPHQAGVALGFSLMLALGAAGVGAALARWPSLADALQAAGAAWLAWMGLRMAWSAGRAAPSAGAGARGRGLAGVPTVLGSAAFQFANPKAWMLAVATASAYADLARPGWLAVVLICAIFSACTVVALTLWSAGADAVGRRLDPAGRRALDAALGASLVATAAWVAWR